MDTQADKDNPSAISHQTSAQASARTEASVAEYLFYHCDHLGTVRLITDNNGDVVSRHDYEPFGVEIAPVVKTANNTHQFTGHERDANTGYDYMHYRSYGSNIGRFMKPDNITGNPLNPQSWNLYSYVRGNPVNFNDPTGHAAMESSSSGDQNANDAAEPASDMVTPGGATAEQQTKERQHKLEQKKAQPKKVEVEDVAKEDKKTEEKSPTDEKQKVTEKVFTGEASYYNLPGNKTASGELFDSSAMAGAMTADKVKKLPQEVTVEYASTDKEGNKEVKSITVKVNDRGPFAMDSKGKALKPLKPHPTRIIDLTPAAFKALAGNLDAGHISVTVKVPQ